MARRRLGPLEFPVDTSFRWWHALAWLAWLWVLQLNLEMLWEARQSGAFYLLPAIGLAWVAVFTAGGFIENWLDGANRFATFRVALILSALVSGALGAWMLWHYGTFLLVGLVTFFRQPFELISLSTMGARLAAVCASIATFALFAWLSLRVAWILLSGERNAHFGQVLGEDAYGAGPGATEDGVAVHAPARSPAHEPPRTPAPATRPQAAPVPRRRTPPPPDGPPGKQRYLARPPALDTDASNFMHGLSYRRGIARDKAERCAELGWPAFEWVFRTQPSLHELACALEALPGLAASADEDDALEARAWMSRLADHPGAYEQDLPRQEVINEVGSVTVRIADLALQALLDWDAERGRLLRAPPAPRTDTMPP